MLFKIIDSANIIDLLGLPLGNTLSQISANIYMNELDQYCKRKLGIKYYIRYADDVIIVVENKSKAKIILNYIGEFIESELHLRFNSDKTKTFPLEQGVNAIGFKNYKTHKLMRDSNKKTFKRKVKKLELLLAKGEITKEKAEQILNSVYGHAKNGCSYNFIKKLMEEYKYIYFNAKGVIKIDMSKLGRGDVNAA